MASHHVELELQQVVANGFVVGPGTYLKDGWNVLDGSLVLVSLIDVIITYRSSTSASEVLGTLKVFRALRTLRPLRWDMQYSALRRAEWTKAKDQTLFNFCQTIMSLIWWSFRKDEVDGSENVIWKCNFAFLQSLLNYSKSLPLQNVF